MSERLQKLISSFCLVVFVLSFIFAELGHKHFLSIAGSSSPEYQSHDCTTRELHKTISVEKHCVLCQRIAQHGSVLSPVVNTVELSKSPLPATTHLFVRFENVLRTFPTRGPPLFIG